MRVMLKLSNSHYLSSSHRRRLGKPAAWIVGTGTIWDLWTLATGESHCDLGRATILDFLGPADGFRPPLQCKGDSFPQVELGTVGRYP